MSKVVCPDCGGNLTFEFLCQYGLQQKVSSIGRKLLAATKEEHYGAEIRKSV